MEGRVQVVEPTLEGYSGHCYSLVRSFCQAAAGAWISLWAAKGAASLDFGPGATVHPFFRRRIRLPQALYLFRRLLRETSPVLVTTARRIDLALIDLAAPGKIPPNRVFLYFHWFRETPGKLRFLRKIAARQPEIVILGTTATVVEAFRRGGFARVFLLPYPATHAPDAPAAMPFRQLLYAGAARQDKGFREVVDFVELLAGKGERIPITIQVSADHYGKYDPATRADIARLQAVGYAPLSLTGETLSPEDYSALFPGSICLQPYHREEFRDRVSGVTLDALAHGCPIVATAGTWTAGLIVPAGAGVALPDPRGEHLYAAVRQIRDRYPEYRDRALAAGGVQNRRSWAALLDLLDPGLPREPGG